MRSKKWIKSSTGAKLYQCTKCSVFVDSEGYTKKGKHKECDPREAERTKQAMNRAMKDVNKLFSGRS